MSEVSISLLALGLSILGTLMWLIFSSGRMYQQLKEQIKHLQETSNALQKTSNDLQKSLNDTNTKLSQVFRTTTAIVTYLVTRDASVEESLFTGGSPVELTKNGHRLLEDSGGQKYINDNLEYLISSMERATCKSPLDVQYVAETTISDDSDSDDFVHIKNFIYNNPDKKHRDSNLGLSIIIKVLGISLREKYLKKYPELSSVKSRAPAGTS